MASGGFSGPTWTWEEDKVFESALTMYDLNSPGCWDEIAMDVGGGKTAEDVKKHYYDIVTNIKPDRVPYPCVPMPSDIIRGKGEGISKSTEDNGKDKTVEEQGKDNMLEYIIDNHFNLC